MMDTWLKSAIGISACPLAISTPTIVINAKGVSSTTRYLAAHAFVDVDDLRDHDDRRVCNLGPSEHRLVPHRSTSVRSASGFCGSAA